MQHVVTQTHFIAVFAFLQCTNTVG